MKKLSSKAKYILIIQTILTFGFNWLYFLIYYVFDYYSVKQLNVNCSNKVRLNKKIIVRSISIGIIYYLIFYTMVFMMQQINSVYFVFHPFSDLFKQFKLVAIINIMLYALVTYGIMFYLYTTLFKWFYYNKFKEKYQYFYGDKSLNRQFVILSIVTLGVYLLISLMIIGVHEAYIYILNRKKSSIKHAFSLFGLLGLMLTLAVYVSTSIYIINLWDHLFVLNKYAIILSMLTPLLNYGLYEYKMHLLLDNNIELLSLPEKENVEINQSKKIMIYGVSLASTVFSFVIVFLAATTIEPPIKNQAIAAMNKDELTCEALEINTICYNPTPNLFPRINGYYPIENDQFNETEAVMSYHYADEIDRKPIHYLENDSEVIYQSKGALYKWESQEYNQIRYVYVQTYYHLLENQTYSPAFNIVKLMNVEFVTGKMTNTSLTSNVYLYDFNKNEIKEYHENYQQIDSTQLIIDNLNIEVESTHNNIFGINSLPLNTLNLDIYPYKVKDTTRYLRGFLDPFMISELFTFNRVMNKEYPSYSQREKLKFKDIFNAVLLPNRHVDQISHQNDDAYMMMELDQVHYRGSYAYIDRSYEYSYYNPEYTSTINLDDVRGDKKFMFGSRSKKQFSISSATNEVYGEFTFTYEVKTVKQYFKDEVIESENIVIRDLAY